MDSVTKKFVIAACSVTIATPIAWFGYGLYLKYSANKELKKLEALETKLQKEQICNQFYEVYKSMIADSDEYLKLASEADYKKRLLEQKNRAKECYEAIEKTE